MNWRRTPAAVPENLRQTKGHRQNQARMHFRDTPVVTDQVEARNIAAGIGDPQRNEKNRYARPDHAHHNVGIKFHPIAEAPGTQQRIEAIERIDPEPAKRIWRTPRKRLDTYPEVRNP